MQKTGSHLINKCIHLITGKKSTHIIGGINWEYNFAWGHPSNANFSPWLQKGYRLFTMIRDPRDHLVSIMRHNQPPFNKIFTFEEIQHGITQYLTHFADAYAQYHGGQKTIGGGCYGTTLNQIWVPFINALRNPDICVARFEKLVGPEGHGCTREVQCEEIKKIAAFMNVSLTQGEAEYVAENIHGGTATFVEGQVGVWQRYFTENHKMLCKKNANNALVQLGYEHDDQW